MAKYRKPKKKYLRRFGMIEEEKKVVKNIKRKKRKTDFGIRFEEKQKLKFIYGISERQLKRYIKSALKTNDPVKTFLEILETRLDNAIYRLGFAKTRAHARQLINHRHIFVNEKRVNIPSYNVAPNEKIILSEREYDNIFVQDALKNKKPEDLPSWLWRDKNEAEITGLPNKNDFPRDIDVGKVIEFYR